jgi:hypothetical protein
LLISPLFKKIILFTALLFVVALASHYPAFIEQYYTHRLFVCISGFLRLLFNYIPFSVGDLGYAALVVWAIYGIGVCIKATFKCKFKLLGTYLLKGILTLQVLFFMFYILWGLNYSRQPAYQVLNLRDTSYSMSDVHNVATMLLDSLNTTRAQLKSPELQTGNTQLFAASAIAVNQLKKQYLHVSGYNPHVKGSIFTPLINYMGTSGYNNPFTGEAQMNTQMPVFDRPVTACHEMAHQLGFAREDEANFIGFLAGSRSADVLQRYSAYYLASQEFLYYLRRRDSIIYKQLKLQFSPQVKADFKTDSVYWTRYEGKLEHLTGSFYNAFLKVNKQPDGLRTYNRMIILTIAYYRHHQKIRR